jgi:hypothetical protein
VKKIRANKSAGVIIHIYMEISQRNSLCSYFYLKIEEQERGTGSAKGREMVGTSGSRESEYGVKNVCMCM